MDLDRKILSTYIFPTMNYKYSTLINIGHLIIPQELNPTYILTLKIPFN